MKKLHTDERGLGHVVMILVAVAVIAAIGAIGYTVSQKGKDSKTTSGAKVVSDKAAVDACNKVWHDKDLCKFTGNYAIDKLSFKMVMTTTAADGTSTSTFLSDGKGNTSMSGVSAGEHVDFISLDNTTYMKDNSDGSWYKFSVNSAGAPKVENPTSNVKIDTSTDLAASSNYSYKKLGKEACGSLTCFKYQMTDKSQPKTINYVWFDDKDYKMQHYYYKDDSSSNDMVITYQAVKITAPSPTKDFSAAAGIDPSQLSSGSEE